MGLGVMWLLSARKDVGGVGEGAGTMQKEYRGGWSDNIPQ